MPAVMSDPCGFLLTWTCYGAWLHGDPRGSVDEHHGTYSFPKAAGNLRRVEANRAHLRCPAFVLDERGRAVVARTLMDHCRHRRWTLHAANVRSNHVHVVVGYARRSPEFVMRDFKSWCTRRLREAGLAEVNARVWSEHGSTKYLWTEADVTGAMNYVNAGQGRERFEGRKDRP